MEEKINKKNKNTLDVIKEKINKKNKNTLDVIKEVAELYGFEITECEKGKGGFYDGDEKLEISLEEMFDDF